jgi:hypothetical protein
VHRDFPSATAISKSWLEPKLGPFYQEQPAGNDGTGTTIAWKRKVRQLEKHFYTCERFDLTMHA